MADYLDNKVVLVTGGTGSFGKAFTEHVLRTSAVKKLIILSRDELKQYEMQQTFTDDRLRYFLGDVRDKSRLYRAFDGVDVVVHAAALKQVPAAEYNPLECIKTNIGGAENVIEAAIDRGVSKVLALSTDKAVSPSNLYGATKLCSDKLFVAANRYSGDHVSRFCCVRYGNVIHSRGSVVPLFKAKYAQGQPFPITHPDMTRFLLTLPHAVEFVIDSIERMEGGEIFVPKIPSAKIVDIAEAVAGPGFSYNVVGIRPGEKLHEVLISESEGRNTLDWGTRYAVMPYETPWANFNFTYASNTNQQKLTVEQIRAIL